MDTDYTPEEVQAGLPDLIARYGHDYATDRGTEYLDGYDLTFRFGFDERGWSTERTQVRYYY